MAGTFEIYQDRKGGFRFRLKARNGEIVATGESYPTEKAALKGVAGVQRAALDAKVVTPAAAPAKKAAVKKAAPAKKAAVAADGAPASG